MTLDKPDMLLWMDVETTGLDPDHDRILEVEMRCTDMRGVRYVGGFRRVIGLIGRMMACGTSSSAGRENSVANQSPTRLEMPDTRKRRRQTDSRNMSTASRNRSLSIRQAAIRSSTSTSSAASARTSRCTTTASTWPPSATVSKPPDGT